MMRTLRGNLRVGAALAWAVALAIQAQAAPRWAPYAAAALAFGAAALALLARFRTRSRVPEAEAPDGLLQDCVAGALLLALAFYLVSPALRRTDTFFIRWLPAPSRSLPVARWGLARFLILTAVLTPLFCFGTRRGLSLLLVSVAVAAPVVCAVVFLRHTGGAALYNDDHPSFLHRLWIFARTFPQYLYYDPTWNGGHLGSSLVASGVVPLGLLAWPLARIFPVERFYTPLLAFCFMGLVPALAAGAVRLSGGSRTAACCGAVMALGTGYYFFLWTLHFGTVGSSLCLACAPLMLASFYRMLWREPPTPTAAAALIFSTFVFVSWPPAGLLMIPVAVATLLSARAWSIRKIGILAACAVALAVLYRPYLRAIFARVDVASFVRPAKSPAWAPRAWLKGAACVSATLRGLHPLLLIAGLGGWPWVRQRGFALFYGTVLLIWLALTGWGETLWPEIPFSRTAVPLGFAAIVPAALIVGDWMERGTARTAPWRAALFALLLVGTDSVTKYLRSPPHLPHRTMPKDVRELVGWIREHVPEGGRVLFAGPTLHAYGRGHVAFLPVLTGREMLASDYYHFSPSRVDYEYPPRPFRANEQTVCQFLELYNVACVITHHGRWKRFFRNAGDRYVAVAEFPGHHSKTAFQVRQALDSLLEGEGSVEADVNRLRVRLNEPTERVVLKYNWAEDLVADPPVELAPFEAGGGIRLIAAYPHGSTNFCLRYVGPRHRSLLARR